MNEKIIFEILKYVAVFFISIFLPKKISYITRTFISYFFNNCIKYWLYFLALTALYLIFFFNHNKLTFEEYVNYKTLIVLFLSLSFIINLYVFLKFFLTKSDVFFSIYPTFTIKENEFIINDIQSEKINDIITIKLKKIRSKFFVFRNEIVHTKVIDVPEFFPILLGFKNYINFINKKLNTKNPISLYLQKDLLDSELRTYLFFNDKQFVNAGGFKDVEDLALKISLSKERNLDDKIESILFLYIFICSQSFLDLTLDVQEYDDTLKILYDLDEQISILKKELELFKFDSNVVNLFYNNWKGMIFRYYSIVYLEKKENIKAVDFIFEADNSNPYFPYNTHEKGREHYITKYMLEIIPNVDFFKESLEIENNETETNNKIVNLKNKLEFESTRPNYNILIEIIKRNEDNIELLKYIEEKLENSLKDNSNVFSLIFIAESYKYLPLGDEMENKIYVNRIPKVVEILENAIAIDKEFELLHIRIGSLKFMYSVRNSIDDAEMEKVANYIQKYSYLYSKYGF